jgi:hypothetical protein
MRLKALTFALALIGTAGLADAQESGFNLELNNIKEIPQGCRVAFLASNQLGTTVQKLSVEIVVFDENSKVSDVVVFEFGRLPNGRSKVAQFDLSHQCGSISKLLLNNIKECSGDKDIRQECEDRMKTTSRVNIAFE